MALVNDKMSIVADQIQDLVPSTETLDQCCTQLNPGAAVRSMDITCYWYGSL
jgi:hypothetical protein